MDLDKGETKRKAKTVKDEEDEKNEK